MTETRTRPSVSARIIHLALVAGVVLPVGAFALVRSGQGADAGSAQTFAVVAFATATVCFGAALVLRRRLDPPARGASVDEWWAANQERAIVLWALIEGPSLFGAVAFFVTGGILPLLVPGVGLLLLALTAPGRLAGE